MNPQDHRARTITTAEGRYVNLNDIKLALQDDAFVQECAKMLLVARDLGYPPSEGCRRMIGRSLLILVGDEAKLTGKPPQ